MTKISQDQIDLGSETALDLLVKSNEDKATLAATLTNKGTAANPDTETWSALLTKTADLNVEAGRALLDVPIVSRTIAKLYGTTHNFCGIAHKRWAFSWINTTTLRRLDLYNETVLPAYDTAYDFTGVPTAYTDIPVTGIAFSAPFHKQSYVENNQIIMCNKTTLSIYDVEEATGILTLSNSISLSTSLPVGFGLFGSNSDRSKFLVYSSNSYETDSHSLFRYISAADGNVNTFNSVPTGSSSHLKGTLYGASDCLFVSSKPASVNTSHHTVSHFAVDWSSLTISDTGKSFQCDGTESFGNNITVLTSSSTSKRYIPFHNNATFLYGLDDGLSTKICEGAGIANSEYNNAVSPTITSLSNGGYVVMSNYGLPIFLNADLEVIYSGVADKNNTVIGCFKTESTPFGECQIYDEDKETVYAFLQNEASSLYAAKFHVHLNKVAGYTRLHNGVTTPFWAQTTDADIAAGALDKAEAV